MSTGHGKISAKSPGSEKNCSCAAAGFTLVELLTAIAIVAILAALAIPSYAAYINKARVQRAIIEIQMLQTEISVYKLDHGNLPDTLGDIGRSDLTDPWGNPYRYLRLDSGAPGINALRRQDKWVNPINTDYDLYSMGKDGQSKKQLNNKLSVDDIVRANNGAFIDLAEKF